MIPTRGSFISVAILSNQTQAILLNRVSNYNEENVFYPVTSAKFTSSSGLTDSRVSSLSDEGHSFCELQAL